MIKRTIWLERIRQSWQKAPLVWLTGVRRSGKTTLAGMIPEARYINCDLPSSARLLLDLEGFYESISETVVIFDEIHKLDNPSQVLKVGTDHFKHLRLLATGSSTLAATKKFRDSLTGRKRVVHLLPVLEKELAAFGVKDIKKRLLHGGLPEPLLADKKDPEFFSEWLDSYFARDVQELFRVGKRRNFLALVEQVLRHSGGLLDQSKLARQCGISRPTVGTYLDALDLTYLAFFVRPYHAGGNQELVRQPKVYGFDTGFVTHVRGWTELREEDLGILFEHLVLESLVATAGIEAIRFWRDKQKREVDFVLPHGRSAAHAIECKLNPDKVPTAALLAFRGLHPKGENFVVSPRVKETYKRKINNLAITFCSLGQLVDLIDTSAR